MTIASCNYWIIWKDLNKLIPLWQTIIGSRQNIQSRIKILDIIKPMPVLFGKIDLSSDGRTHCFEPNENSLKVGSTWPKMTIGLRCAFIVIGLHAVMIINIIFNTFHTSPRIIILVSSGHNFGYLLVVKSWWLSLLDWYLYPAVRSGFEMWKVFCCVYSMWCLFWSSCSWPLT